MTAIRALIIIVGLFFVAGCQTETSVVRVLENTKWKPGTIQDVLVNAKQVEAIYLAADLYGKFDINDLETGFESPRNVEIIMSDIAKVKYVKHEEWRGQALAFRFKNGTGIYVIALPDERGFVYGPYYESRELYNRFRDWGIIHEK